MSLLLYFLAAQTTASLNHESLLKGNNSEVVMFDPVYRQLNDVVRSQYHLFTNFEFQDFVLLVSTPEIDFLTNEFSPTFLKSLFILDRDLRNKLFEIPVDKDASTQEAQGMLGLEDAVLAHSWERSYKRNQHSLLSVLRRIF